MKLVQTLVVRDEADIIDAHLAYHLNAGVDFVIAPVLWLVLGLAGLVIRRPTNVLAMSTPAAAALIVIVLSALAIAANPHYSVPVTPAFVLLAAGALLGSRRGEEQT